MITEAIMNVLYGLWAVLMAALGALLPDAPDWWLDASDAVEVVLGNVGAPIRHFVPLGPLLRAGLALMALFVALGVLRLVRRALSLFTGGGGAG